MEAQFANMTKKIGYDKKEKWTSHTYYQIYMEDEVKMIKIIGSTNRGDAGKPYLSWFCKFCKDDCIARLDDFLEWDVYYQLNALYENSTKIKEIEVEPYECFAQANLWVKADGNGSEFKRFIDLTEDVPCGYYYGY